MTTARDFSDIFCVVGGKGHLDAATLAEMAGHLNATVPDIETAAMECWRQTKNDSVDWDWERVNTTRKAAYRRMAVAILSAAGCINGLGG